MIKKGLLARLEAKPGKEEELEAFLKNALPLAQAERGTVTWHAMRISHNIFGIFDTFDGEEGYRAYLSGPIATALATIVGSLLVQPPLLEMVEVLAAK